MSLGAGGERVRVGPGSYEWTQAAPGIVVVTFVGHGTEELAKSLRTAIDAVEPPITRLFFDTEGLTSFDPEFRQRMMVWHAATKHSRLQSVLVRSALVAAAITFANKLIGGGVEMTSKRAKWERALAAAVDAVETLDDVTKR